MVISRNKTLILIFAFMLSMNVGAHEYTATEYQSEYQSFKKKCDFKKVDRQDFSRLDSNRVGWVVNDSQCKGYFTQAKFDKTVKEDGHLYFNADKNTMISETDISFLKGNASLSYKDNRLFADTICYSKHKSFKSIFVANKKVNFQKDGLLILADTAIWYANGRGYFNNTFYRIKSSSNKGLGEFWGQAEEVWFPKKNKISFSNLSISNCSFTRPDWVLEATNLSVDNITNQGLAKGLWLRLFGQRVFYIPILGFPFTSERQSGFLHPTVGYTSDGGYSVSVPYYWNLAPNYDLTTSLVYFSERGLAWKGLFRFITPKSSGKLTLFNVFDDSAFETFKEETVPEYENSSNSSEQFLATSLSNSSAYRFFFAYNQSYTLSPKAYLNLNYNYMSDDYMSDDFTQVRAILPSRKLPRNFSLNYDNGYIRTEFLLQKDQVLQPLGQDIIEGLFSALPVVSSRLQYFSKDYPDIQFDLFTSFLHFSPLDSSLQKNSSQENINIDGDRFIIDPVFSIFNYKPWYRGTFKFGFNASYYDWNNQNTDVASDNHVFVPWLSYEKKAMLSFEDSYFSFSLQPRLFYKYIAYRDQNNLPVLDTYLPADNYQNLFRLNRFVGHDRIGDANSLTMALETFWFEKNSGDLIASFDIAKNYAFRLHRVCLSDDCQEDPQAIHNFSPWEFKFSLFKGNYSTDFVLSLDNEFENSNSIYSDLHYSGANLDYKIYYSSVNYLSLFPMDVTKSKIIGGTVKSRIQENLNLEAEVQYNFDDQTSTGFFVGLDYTSCCLNSSIGFQHRYQGLDANGDKDYQNSFIVRVYLSGFG